VHFKEAKVHGHYIASCSIHTDYSTSLTLSTPVAQHSVMGGCRG